MLTSRNLGIVLGVALATVFVAVVTAVVAAGQQDGVLGGGLVGEEQARAEVAGAVGSVSLDMAERAHDVRRAAAALREATADAVAGNGAEDLRDRIDHLVRRLSDASSELDAAVHTVVPVRPGSLPVTTVERILDQVARSGGQAADVAARADAAADHTGELALAALELNAEAARFIAASDDLPVGDDPDEIAAAWRAELERLAPYRDAAERAADHASLAEVAAAHLNLVAGLEDDARAALDHLDDGDIGGYNERREARLEETRDIGDDLLAAVQTSLEASVAAVEDVEARALALLTELRILRHDTTRLLGHD